MHPSILAPNDHKTKCEIIFLEVLFLAISILQVFSYLLLFFFFVPQLIYTSITFEGWRHVPGVALFWKACTSRKWQKEVRINSETFPPLYELTAGRYERSCGSQHFFFFIWEKSGFKQTKIQRCDGAKGQKDQPAVTAAAFSKQKLLSRFICVGKLLINPQIKNSYAVWKSVLLEPN